MEVTDRNGEDMEVRALGLLSKYRAQLYVDALALCRDPVMAESLVLHVIDTALRSYDEKTSNIYPLLKTILRNTYINETRRMVDRATVPVDFAGSEGDPRLTVNTTDDEILGNSDREALGNAIKRLKPEYKRAIVMHYLMDMPLKEIARVLKCPVGTVKWRLSIARDALAAMLKRSLGRTGTWVFLFCGMLLGCVATVAIVRMPGRAAGERPHGGPSYNTPRVSEIAVPRAPREVAIDGDLGEWTPPVFDTACDPPYDRDYKASIRAMWDEKRLYIGGDVRTPDPMCNMGDSTPIMHFAGGSIVCRFAADANQGWPLSADMGYNPGRPPERPLPDDGLVSLVLYYDAGADAARLDAIRRMRLTERIDIPAEGWRGAYREHSDGRGYQFEYAVEWSAVGIVPPKAGETRANTWNIHFSDAQGLVCIGQIVENVVPAPVPGVRDLRPVSFCYYPMLWGKAVFE